MVVFYTIIDTVFDHTVAHVLGYFGMGRTHKEASRSLLLSGPQSTDESNTIQDNHSDSLTSSQNEKTTMKAIGTLMAERKAESALEHVVGYITSAEVPLFAKPTKDFDTVIMKISYGTMVMVLEEKGRFSRVALNGVTGWVLRDDIVDRAAYVYPEFIEGEKNLFDDPSTLRVRAYIKDIFSGGEAEIPLQSGEYVLYKILKRGLSIDWPPPRPRTPGLWHIILRGVPGVHIGVVPKMGSIMEYTLKNDIGHLAYVEAVFPDGRITFSGVNNPNEGVYHEETLPKEAWQELKPIFIHIS